MINDEYTSYDSATGWVADMVRRKPEAMLLMAAGCALLMRGAGRSWRPGVRTLDGAPRFGETVRQAADKVSQTVGQASEAGSGYAGDLKDRIADAASSYGETASAYAQQARDAFAAGSERISRQAQSVAGTASENLREQPLLVAALGLAAGAAVASLFPPTELERRTLGAAGESVREAAHRAGGTLSEAATQAAQHLKDEAASRGITPDGLKQMAREASNTFTTSVTEGTEQRAPKVTEGTEQRTPNRRTGMSGPE